MKEKVDYLNWINQQYSVLQDSGEIQSFC